MDTMLWVVIIGFIGLSAFSSYNKHKTKQAKISAKHDVNIHKTTVNVDANLAKAQGTADMQRTLAVGVSQSAHNVSKGVGEATSSIGKGVGNNVVEIAQVAAVAANPTSAIGLTTKKREIAMNNFDQNHDDS